MLGEGRGLSSRQTPDVVRIWRLGNLATPKSVQKLQTALHAKAKTEAGYRFYALYDKISRDDILAHAYAQCRSNKGAPGVDGQDFADIEAYGVERWLGELALALRQETYRPEPIRRVFIPKANGKLRPLGISTVWDRVCMTAASSGNDRGVLILIRSTLLALAHANATGNYTVLRDLGAPSYLKLTASVAWVPGARLTNWNASGSVFSRR